MTLTNEYRRIEQDHRHALKWTAARSGLTPSVIRVYAPKTKEVLVEALTEIDIDALRQIRSQREFSVWFDRNVERIAQVIAGLNPDNKKIQPGYKWGHATKIVAIFIRDMVLSSRYFSEAEAERITPLLYVPIDGIVMGRLRKVGIKLPFTAIKDIATRNLFYEVQDQLGEAAAEAGVPRVWFDDIWADRRAAKGG